MDLSQSVVQQRRVARNVAEDPVGFWLSRVDVDTRPAHKSHFLRWIGWLNHQPCWDGVTLAICWFGRCTWPWPRLKRKVRGRSQRRRSLVLLR